jgi:hypothetical protein
MYEQDAPMPEGWIESARVAFISVQSMMGLLEAVQPDPTVS